MVIGGRFTLEAQVAAGGMGVVHRARDAQTGARVALKLLTGSDPDNLERFVREATILAELDHPSIVRYIAHGTSDSGVPYLAMDWVEGETLYKRLATAGISLAETVELGRQVAAGLAYAHARGVIHRDIKPGNLVLHDGQVSIVDFGVARASMASSSLTETGAMLGTPSYMAPEQARGERTIAASADVFSLGCVLFECATGRLTFEGRHMLALVAKIVLWTPPRVRMLVPDAPPALDELIARMLAKDAAARPRDAEVSAMLAAIRIRPGLPRRQVSRDDAATVTPALAPRRLVTIVAATAADESAPRPSFEALEARRAALATSFAPFDVHFELLYDGSVVAIAAGAEPAAVVQRALGCARGIRSAAPDLLIAIKSGPLDGEDAVAAAAKHLLEATVAALAKEAMAAIFGEITTPTRPQSAIRLDDATARLCPPDTIVHTAGVYYLAAL